MGTLLCTFTQNKLKSAGCVFPISLIQVNLLFKNHPVLLSPESSFFENAVDPDQMASTKPSDQDLHCFPLLLKMHA